MRPVKRTVVCVRDITYTPIDTIMYTTRCTEVCTVLHGSGPSNVYVSDKEHTVAYEIRKALPGFPLYLLVVPPFTKK